MTRRSMIAMLLVLVALPVVQSVGLDVGSEENVKPLTVVPIGSFEVEGDRTRIVLDERYQAGLLGLDGYSHIQVFWWFSKNDTPQKRATLQVYPRGDRKNPRTGVFATRSPVRPNLIALTLCKVIAVEKNVIEIERTDAFDGTPVLDIKPFIPGYDSVDNAKVPDWLRRS